MSEESRSKAIEVIEKMKAELDEDLSVNEINIEKKLYSIPHIHSKWLFKYLKSADKYNKQHDKVSRIYRSTYNSLKSNQNYRVDSHQITKLIEGDDGYIIENSALDEMALVMKFLETAVKKVNDMSFIIENIIEYKKFANGR